MVYDLPQTPSAFYNYLLSRAINALKMNTFVDNFDSARFNLNGIDHSRSWKPLERAFYFDWMFKNQEHLFAAYSALDNEESQNLYIQLIMYRMAGHFCVRLPVAFADKKEELEQYIAAEKFTPSKIELSGMFGGLKHFDFEHKGKNMSPTAWVSNPICSAANISTRSMA
ncbi:hypothetical protein PSTG_18135 [Puccinia striiformis f. sp. tritici PST-78]|uniref:Uncharacterized protein n=1 Tax=Puccinia striiformis f. sp. tritici PST-78 TaxID=1165861 RepID=A0A0L0UP01_9BASI|nr:hypothetical protein PSTG_18135 [Puccinia striiformis f. sp. tritici PST-78]